MRPYIIAHMASSLDGRIEPQQWGDFKGIEEYERTGQILDGDAWMVGRITMEKHFASEQHPQMLEGTDKVERIDFVANHQAESFAIGVDASGKLFYDKAYIDDDHIITVLSENVSDAYLQYLQGKGVSYIFGGKDEINFESVMKKLADLFNIKRLLLEGGGGINGSVIKAGLVDELSMLLFPLVDGTWDTPSLFDIKTLQQKHPAAKFSLLSVEQLKNEIVWLRYKVERR